MPTVWMRLRSHEPSAHTHTHTRSSHMEEKGNNVSRADMTKLKLIISIMMIRSFISSDSFIIICRECFQILTKQIWIALFGINKHSNTHVDTEAGGCSRFTCRILHAMHQILREMRHLLHANANWIFFSFWRSSLDTFYVNLTSCQATYLPRKSRLIVK